MRFSETTLWLQDSETHSRPAEVAESDPRRVSQSWLKGAWHNMTRGYKVMADWCKHTFKKKHIDVMDKLVPSLTKAIKMHLGCSFLYGQ